MLQTFLGQVPLMLYQPCIPLKIFSALQAKRIILITHYHGLYQSLPHHGTFNVDALTT